MPVQVVRKQVNYKVLGLMLLGGLPGVVIGSLLFKRGVAPKIPNRMLRLALSIWLTVIGLEFCWQALHR